MNRTTARNIGLAALALLLGGGTLLAPQKDVTSG